MKERQEAIKRYIERKGDVTLSELAQEFSDWSEMTIRRDLEFLEQRRFLIRTKRGARIMPTSYEVSVGMYGEREKRNCDLKQEIAAKAAALVETDISMYLDAGSTAMMLARELPDRNLIITTSAPNIGIEIVL
ncbi:MAG: DeoR/GlpR transcriptional regulator, partial [Lentisphaeria bacterium]|nr:DeoR/GlpR transcriptional regulator [Lentisphaeria bacterium]